MSEKVDFVSVDLMEYEQPVPANHRMVVPASAIGPTMDTWQGGENPYAYTADRGHILDLARWALRQEGEVPPVAFMGVLRRHSGIRENAKTVPTSDAVSEMDTLDALGSPAVPVQETDHTVPAFTRRLVGTAANFLLPL